jgi:hypothetical protein
MPNLDLAGVFTAKYESGGWGSPCSGPGSTLEATREIREFLPYLLDYLSINSILDCPCGDLSWFSLIPIPINIKYTGADIVPGLIAANQAAYSDITRDFVVADITCDALPKVDLVFCRDLSIHLPNTYITQALANIKASGSKYLLTTSFMAQPCNDDIEPGAFHPVNLLVEPFNLPYPMLAFQEPASRDAWPDKCLALFAINRIPV